MQLISHKTSHHDPRFLRRSPNRPFLLAIGTSVDTVGVAPRLHDLVRHAKLVRDLQVGSRSVRPICIALDRRQPGGAHVHRPSSALSRAAA
jgi:hypothetical protein